jgi:hypothetical protein
MTLPLDQQEANHEDERRVEPKLLNKIRSHESNDKMPRLRRIPACCYRVAAMLSLALWAHLRPSPLCPNWHIPNGNSFLCEPGLIWLHLTSNCLIGLSYLVISASLTFLTFEGRSNIPFHRLSVASGEVILACDTTFARVRERNGTP